jgi:hypothetical protein
VTVVDDLAARRGGVHDVEEARIGPPAFIPLSDDLLVAEQLHWRLRDEVDGAERELEIELSDPNLRGELSDNARQVEIATPATWSEIKKLSKATDADRAEARAELEEEIRS